MTEKSEILFPAPCCAPAMTHIEPQARKSLKTHSNKHSLCESGKHSLVQSGICVGNGLSEGSSLFLSCGFGQACRAKCLEQ